MSKAEEKVILQEYYQTHGVRPGSRIEADLLEAENKKEKVLCHVYVQKYRAFFLKRYVKNVHRDVEAKADPKDAYLFILVGERSQVDYLQTRIEMITTKVPMDFLTVEYEK